MSDAKFRPVNRQAFRENLSLFREVIETYLAVLEMPLTNAMQINRDMPFPARLAPGTASLHFKIDVENVTTAALRDRPELQRAWFKFAEGEQIAPSLEIELVNKCARIYEQRGLQPCQYFRAIRRGGARKLSGGTN